MKFTKLENPERVSPDNKTLGTRCAFCEEREGTHVSDDGRLACSLCVKRLEGKDG